MIFYVESNIDVEFMNFKLPTYAIFVLQRKILCDKCIGGYGYQNPAVRKGENVDEVVRELVGT